MKKRSKEENYKYIEFNWKTKKKSFVNLQQIINKKNIKDIVVSNMDNTDFYDLLMKFYNYQMSLKPKSKEFERIQKDIETLLVLIEININLKLNKEKINKRQFDIFKNIKNRNQIPNLYKMCLVIDNKVPIHKYFLSQKQINKCKKIIEVYENIKRINLQDIDLNDNNNELRSLYIKMKSENCLLNMETIFEDLVEVISFIDAYDFGKADILKKFIEKEKKAESEKQIIRKLKIKTKKNDRNKNNGNQLSQEEI